MLGRISYCIGSLILILMSVLLASNAYAQFSPTPFIDLEYFYDGVGNVESVIDHIDSQNNSTMQYDSLDRLTVADGPWGAGSFTYDSIGNRTSKDINAQNINYTYGTSDNRLSGLSYDANGNVINDGTFTYTYDSENRLVQVTNGADVITYGYDGDGRRISQTVNEETTIFAYGVGLNVLTEFAGSGVPKYEYIYAGSRNIARINFDGAGVPVSKTFYHPDHLGSTIGLTDQETTKVWDRTYLPYGGTFTGAGTTENTHQYTAKELEAATGLYYYGARYHNPNIGRFMSPDRAGADPSDPQSWNRYAYVQNNPYKYVDPDGEQAVVVDLHRIVEINKRARSKLDFVPDWILDFFIPLDPGAILSSALPGPIALETAVISKSASKALFVTAERFEGVRELSRTLIRAGVSRKARLNIVNSFRQGTITKKIAIGGENPIRYFGGEAFAKGRYLTPSFPIFGSARDVLSLPAENLATKLAQFQLRRGATFFEGIVAPNFKRPGGGIQYFVPNLDDLLQVP
jgi:RHS repeat-associated protein